MGISCIVGNLFDFGIAFCIIKIFCTATYKSIFRRNEIISTIRLSWDILLTFNKQKISQLDFKQILVKNELSAFPRSQHQNRDNI